MDFKENKISFINVGLNDHLPYSKADIVKLSRVSDNFSFSFYQIDYQAMAVNLAINATAKDHSDKLISVGKVVLDSKAFLQLYNEMTEIIKKTGFKVVE